MLQGMLNDLSIGSEQCQNFDKFWKESNTSSGYFTCYNDELDVIYG